uniref:Uncharacterized protein n=1 Tax=Triticum urartu TaxID=4572 RepID=A0A8R7PWK2_TRIUA
MAVGVFCIYLCWSRFGLGKIDFSLQTYMYCHILINKHTIQGCTMSILWFGVYD